MTAKNVSQLAKMYAVSTDTLIHELELIPDLKWNKDRAKGKMKRIIFPTDIPKIFKHLGDPTKED